MLSNFQNQATGLNISSTSPTPSHALDEIHGRLHDIINRAARNADRLHGLRERAFGPRPETGSTGGKPKEVRTGTVGSILDLLDDASLVLGTQDGLLDELDRLT